MTRTESRARQALYVTAAVRSLGAYTKTRPRREARFPGVRTRALALGCHTEWLSCQDFSNSLSAN